MLRIRGGSTYDGDAIHIHGEQEFSQMEEITSLDGTEYFAVELSVDPYDHKKILASNVTVGSTDPDAVHVNVSDEIHANTPPATSVELDDIILTEDENDSFNKKAATFGHVKDLLFTISKYDLNLTWASSGYNFVCLMSTGGVDSTYKSYYHFLMKVTNTTTFDKEIYEIKVNIPEYVYSTPTTSIPIVNIKNVGHNNPSELKGVVLRNVSNQQYNASIWFEFNDITEVEIRITEMRDAFNEVGITPIEYLDTIPVGEYTDYLPIPLINKEINSNIIKSYFFMPEELPFLYGGYRATIEVKSTDSFVTNIQVPKDLNEIYNNYKKDVDGFSNLLGLYAIGIINSDAAIANQPINWSIQWDNGNLTEYNYNSVTHSGNLFNLTGLTDKIWRLDISNGLDEINLNDFPVTMAALISHAGIVGKIYYMGIELFYR